jgi:hypothetical protein
LATTVQHSSEQFGPNADFLRSIDGYDPRVWHDATHFSRRHKVQSLACEADDLSFDTTAVLCNDIAAPANGSGTSFRLHRQADGSP